MRHPARHGGRAGAEGAHPRGHHEGDSKAVNQLLNHSNTAVAAMSGTAPVLYLQYNQSLHLQYNQSLCCK